MVPSWTYIVPTRNHMVPIKPVNLHFLIWKYLRIGISKNRFHIQHHKNMLIFSSTLKSSKFPTFLFKVEPYSSKLELNSSNMDLYSSNLELYGSIWVYLYSGIFARWWLDQSINLSGEGDQALSTDWQLTTWCRCLVTCPNVTSLHVS